MTEMVLTIPLIVVLIAVMGYFGHLMERTQQAHQLIRYETWRQGDGAPGPASRVNSGLSEVKNAFRIDSAVERDARLTAAERSFFPQDANDLLADVVGTLSSEAGELTNLMIAEGTLSHGVANRLSFYSASGEKRLGSATAYLGAQKNAETKAMKRRHVRVGGDWAQTKDFLASFPDWTQRARSDCDASVLGAMSDVFYKEFDAMIQEVSQEGNGRSGDLGKRLGSLYKVSSGYEGPTVQ